MNANSMAKLEQRFRKSNISNVILFFVVFYILMGICRPKFLSINNLSIIIKIFCVTAVVGFSQMVIIGTGGMNLAVGSIGGLTAIITAECMTKFGVPVATSILIGLLSALLLGMLNGVLINHYGGTNAASFLSTLATFSLLKGVTYGVTRGQPVYNLNAEFTQLGLKTIGGIPVLAFVTIVLAVLLWLMFKYMGIGRRILALGSNPISAKLYGVSSRQTLFIAHALSGLLAGCAGIMLMARLGSGQTDIGDDWMMYSFAAPVLGGTRQAGGRVNVFGALLGALLLASIENGLVFLNMDVYWMKFFEGLIILIAAASELVKTKSSSKGGECK